jgi:hypothetical protein
MASESLSLPLQSFALIFVEDRLEFRPHRIEPFANPAMRLLQRAPMTIPPLSQDLPDRVSLFFVSRLDDSLNVSCAATWSSDRLSFSRPLTTDRSEQQRTEDPSEKECADKDQCCFNLDIHCFS